MTAAERIALDGPDGRALEVEAIGSADGVALITHHGTPSAAGAFAPFAEACVRRGLRLVSYSRPGYGGSARHAGRSVADCAADVAAIADALAIERFHTLGGSGGGPHTLACAALLGDRVLSAAAIACPAPFEAEGLDWFAGMGEDNKEEFAATADDDATLQARLERHGEELLAADPEHSADAYGDVVSAVDRAAISGAYGAYGAGQTRRGLASGIWGWFDDNRALLAPWGFDPAVIAVPTTIWHGRHDHYVPCAHGAWLAERIPGAHARLLDDEGHTLRLRHDEAILDELLGAASAPA
jgi:pimeloyl-ACP methyl ester carboxylesterase